MQKFILLLVVCFFVCGCGSVSASGSAASTPVVVSKTLVSVNTVTGEVEITPVIEGDKLIGLVTSNPTEKVLDAAGNIISGYRIAWNDNGSWYPAGGKVALLVLPKTVIAGTAKALGSGAGMPYLVRPDGTFISFNTDPAVCTFSINGAVKTVGTDGLIAY
ncbi:MAG: hypothetical protein WCI36_04090 [bacterium]